jgi:hypothetical protein
MSFPQVVKLQVDLEIEVGDQAEYDYLLDSDGKPQLGFVLDLFDTLKYDSPVTPLKLNNQSFEELKAEHDRRVQQ